MMLVEWQKVSPFVSLFVIYYQMVTKLQTFLLTYSGFYPYIWQVQLAPSEKWGGSFDKVVNHLCT